MSSFVGEATYHIPLLLAFYMGPFVLDPGVGRTSFVRTFLSTLAGFTRVLGECVAVARLPI